MSRHPSSSEEAAVQDWKAAIRLVSNAKVRIELSQLDIHDERDRRRIEQLVEHDVPDDDYLQLHDAFAQLQEEFGDRWE